MAELRAGSAASRSAWFFPRLRGRRLADRARPRATRDEPPPALRRSSWPRWAWRQLTSMRTALVLLFLLALAAVPGSVVPQVTSTRSPSATGRHPDAHPGLRAARAVLGLRLGLVLRDLPPADGLARRLHRAAAADLLARHAGAAADGPANLSRLPAPRSRSRRRAQVLARAAGGCAGGATASCLAATATHRSRGAGLPARGRQPALPPVGPGRPGRVRRGQALRLQGRRHHRGRQGFSNSLSQYDDFAPGVLRPDDLRRSSFTVDDFDVPFTPAEAGQPDGLRGRR